MLSHVVAVSRWLLRSLLANSTPNQLAAGFTLGMIIGLVPKGNLIAVSLCVLVFSLRMNKGFALAAAIVFSVIGPYADAFSHKLGVVILSADALQGVYAAALSLPLSPWLGFHNTVVAGSLVTGLYVAYPVFWVVRTICEYPLGVRCQVSGVREPQSTGGAT
jgi:uncharacterized protein (TIGR03546 family)